MESCFCIQDANDKSPVVCLHLAFLTSHIRKVEHREAVLWKFILYLFYNSLHALQISQIICIGADVCIHIGTDVCIHIGTDVCIHIGTDVCIHIGTDVYIHIGTDVCNSVGGNRSTRTKPTCMICWLYDHVTLSGVQLGLQQ